MMLDMGIMIIAYSNKSATNNIATATASPTFQATQTARKVSTETPILENKPEPYSEEWLSDNGGTCEWRDSGYCMYWNNISKTMDVENDILANSILMNRDEYPKTAEITTSSARAAAFLAMVNRHEADLPHPYMVGDSGLQESTTAIFLAQAYTENGDNYEWDNSQDGGIMQLKAENWRKHVPYENTLESIEYNVEDGMVAWNFFYRNAYKVMFSSTQYGQLHGLIYETSNGTHLRYCLTVLSYNAGFDPFNTYGKWSVNTSYVWSVAEKMKLDVPALFGQYLRANADSDVGNIEIAQDLIQCRNIIDTFGK